MMVSPSTTRVASATETAGELRRLRRELHEVCALAEPRFREYVSWALLTVDAAVAHVDGLAGVSPDFKLHTTAAGAEVRPRRAGSRSRNGPVVSEKVNPAVWEAALQCAGGDRNRLKVISVTSVIVQNEPS